MRRDEEHLENVTRKGGCLAALPALIVLIVAVPPTLAVRFWRRLRRRADVRSSLDVHPFTIHGGEVIRRVDLTLDVPRSSEPEHQRRITDAVIRVAEKLQAPQEAYHLVYRLPWDEEPVLIPIGPRIQGLGERLSLTLAQGTLARRTLVWLILDRERALSELVDPAHYDPEGHGEPEALIARAGAHWAMATSWARVGPSLIVRLILFVPARSAERVIELIEPLRKPLLGSDDA